MEEEIRNQILSLEALRDCIEDGEIEDALAWIDAAIKLLRKQRKKNS